MKATQGEDSRWVFKAEARQRVTYTSPNRSLDARLMEDLG
jgi:hypothetical protein